MSVPSPFQAVVARSRDNNSDQKVLEEKREEDSVEIGDLKTSINDTTSGGPIFVSSIRDDEPIVTRRELWSYYRQSSFFSHPECYCGLISTLFTVYYNGDNVCTFYLVSLFRLKDRSNQGSWTTRIFYDFVPIIGQCSRI